MDRRADPPVAFAIVEQHKADPHARFRLLIGGTAFFAVSIALTRPLGGYLTRVFTGERTTLTCNVLSLNLALDAEAAH